MSVTITHVQIIQVKSLDFGVNRPGFESVLLVFNCVFLEKLLNLHKPLSSLNKRDLLIVPFSYGWEIIPSDNA